MAKHFCHFIRTALVTLAWQGFFTPVMYADGEDGVVHVPSVDVLFDLVCFIDTVLNDPLYQAWDDEIITQIVYHNQALTGPDRRDLKEFNRIHREFKLKYDEDFLYHRQRYEQLLSGTSSSFIDGALRWDYLVHGFESRTAQIKYISFRDYALLNLLALASLAYEHLILKFQQDLSDSRYEPAFAKLRFVYAWLFPTHLLGNAEAGILPRPGAAIVFDPTSTLFEKFNYTAPRKSYLKYARMEIQSARLTFFQFNSRCGDEF